MARGFTSSERVLLKSPDLAVNLLVDFFLDSGTYHFCDELTGFDLTDLTTTWIGANTFADAVEIRTTAAMQAEQVTLTLDGNRLTQAGVSDPARVLSDILGYLYQQRRVNFSFGFRYNYSSYINMVVPVYAGKINTVRLIDKAMTFPDTQGNFRVVPTLEIVLDALAARYNRATYRQRSHNDQQEIDSTDMFYSFTLDVAMNERVVYWGKAAPFGAPGYPTSGSYGTGGTSGVGGGGSPSGDFGGTVHLN